jgi:hypothetical protein
MLVKWPQHDRSGTLTVHHLADTASGSVCYLLDSVGRQKQELTLVRLTGN